MFIEGKTVALMFGCLVVASICIAKAQYYQGRRDSNNEILNVINQMNRLRKQPIIHDIVRREA